MRAAREEEGWCVEGQPAAQDPGDGVVVVCDEGVGRADGVVPGLVPVCDAAAGGGV